MCFLVVGVSRVILFPLISIIFFVSMEVSTLNIKLSPKFILEELMTLITEDPISTCDVNLVEATEVAPDGIVGEG